MGSNKNKLGKGKDDRFKLNKNVIKLLVKGFNVEYKVNDAKLPKLANENISDKLKQIEIATLYRIIKKKKK